MHKREEKRVQNYDWTTRKENGRSKDVGLHRNIRIDFNVTGWKCVDWIPLTCDETNGGSSDHDNEQSDSEKCRYFLIS